MKKFTYILVTFLILVAWLITPVAALAQEEVPPAEETPPAEEVVTEEPAVTVEQVVEVLPEETELVVLDEAGEEVDLSSIESEAVQILGDPMYCPYGAPAGDASCTSFTTLAAAIAFSKLTTDSYGTIYIAWDYDAVAVGESTNTVLVIDEDAWTNVSAYGLSIIGGYDLDPASPNYGSYTGGSSSINMPLLFRDFNDPYYSWITLADLIISQPATAPTAAELRFVDSNYVNAQGLSVVNNSDYDAVVVNNTDFASFYNVHITESGDGSALELRNGSDLFYYNVGTVTESGAGNAITLEGTSSEAISNASLYNLTISESGDSAALRFWYAPYITLSDSTINESGAGNGINAYYATNGYYWGNVITEVDGGDGIYMDYGDDSQYFYNTINESGAGDGVSWYDTYTTTFNNGNIYEYGNGNGFVLESTLNDSFGSSYIEEHGAGNGITMLSSINPYIHDTTIYEYDGGHGIYGNSLTGLDIEYSSVLAAGTGNGIDISSSEGLEITHDYVESDGYGVYLTNNTGSLNLENDTLYYNLYDGLYVTGHVTGSGESITLDTVYSGMNNGAGAYFANSTGALSIFYSQFYYNDGNGLQVSNHIGDILLGDYSYIFSNEGDDGAYFYNNTGSLDISDTQLYSNYWDGLHIEDQYGDISLEEVISSYNYNCPGDCNGGWGAYIYGGTGKTDVISSYFYYNPMDNLGIFNRTGDVLLDTVDVWDSWWSEGVYLDQNVGDVTVLNSNFFTNAYDGLGIGSQDGNVYIENSTFSGNYSDGLWVDGLTGNFKLVSSNLIGNSDQGADINNLGGVMLLFVNAMNNGLEGIYLEAGGNVYGMGLDLEGNLLDGIHIATDGGMSEIYTSIIADNVEKGVDYQAGNTLYLCGNTINNNGIGYAYTGTLIYSDGYPCDWLAPDDGLAPDIVLVEFVGDFTSATPAAGSASFTAERGLIFKLIKTLPEGGEEVWGQVSIPKWSAAAGTTFSFLQKDLTGLPAAMPDGATYLGPAFTLDASAPDGTALNELLGNMEIKLKLADDLVIPSGQMLAILRYDPDTGTWDQLGTSSVGGYAWAYSTLLGSYALALVPMP